jgi:hypothetical protein
MPGGAIVSADFDSTPGVNRFRSGGYTPAPWLCMRINRSRK